MPHSVLYLIYVYIYSIGRVEVMTPAFLMALEAHVTLMIGSGGVGS